MKEQRFKLNKAPYGKSDTVRVYCKYDKKNGGYVAYAELIEVNIIGDENLFGKAFCPEYYKHNGDMWDMVIPAGRRSAKKESEATEIVMSKAEPFAEKFVEHIAMALGIDGLEITERKCIK